MYVPYYHIKNALLNKSELPVFSGHQDETNEAVLSTTPLLFHKQAERPVLPWTSLFFFSFLKSFLLLFNKSNEFTGKIRF